MLGKRLSLKKRPKVDSDTQDISVLSRSVVSEASETLVAPPVVEAQSIQPTASPSPAATTPVRKASRIISEENDEDEDFPAHEGKEAPKIDSSSSESEEEEEEGCAAPEGGSAGSSSELSQDGMCLFFMYMLLFCLSLFPGTFPRRAEGGELQCSAGLPADGCPARAHHELFDSSVKGREYRCAEAVQAPRWYAVHGAVHRAEEAQDVRHAHGTLPVKPMLCSLPVSYLTLGCVAVGR